MFHHIKLPDAPSTILAHNLLDYIYRRLNYLHISIGRNFRQFYGFFFDRETTIVAG